MIEEGREKNINLLLGKMIGQKNKHGQKPS